MLSTLAVLAAGLGSAGEAAAAGYPIGGKILEEYNQAGGSSFFGDAITQEANAANSGRFQKFYKNSSIYWNPNVSGGHANQIGGLIRDKWGGLGFERGYLGYPTTRELAARKPGRYNRFQGGNVYYSSAGGTHPVMGEILKKWGTSDYENGSFGFPVTDEFECATDTEANAKYGGFGQTFQVGNVFFNADDNFTYSTTHSSVFNKTLSYAGQTSFQGELDQAINIWSGLGKIKFEKIVAPDPLYPDYLKIGDYDDSSSTTLGYYSYYGTGTPDVLQFNKSGMAGASQDQRQNLTIHELGHAQGLGHSCTGQIMDPFISDVTSLGNIDRSSYQQLWG